MSKVSGLIGLLLLAAALPALGEPYPLPPWLFYGSSNSGTWDGSSTSPDNAQLTVTLNFPVPPVPGPYATSVGNSSSPVLQLEPATTYTLTLAAMVSGPAVCDAVTQDGNGLIAYTLISGSGWKRYTNSFTTGGPDDSRVGQSLNVQLSLRKSGGSYGTASAFMTNIQLNVTAQRLVLTIQPMGVGQAELRWPTNFYWFVPEYATNLTVDFWEAIADLPTTQSNQLVLPLSLQTGQRFFRLRQP